MIEISQIQDEFFTKVKEKLDARFSLVHEVSETLHISYDSAYRRLRGEKQLTLEEAFELSQHFNISLDSINQTNSNHFTFRTFHVEPEQFCGIKWLDHILSTLMQLYNSQVINMVYAAKDPPIFNYFQFPEIAAFKFFFWEKTLFKTKELEERKFDINDISPELAEKSKKIASLSLKIPTTEIWNEDTFRILMRQIEYYWVSGYFNTKDDLLILLEKIEQWLLHNQKEAECGIRYLYGHEPKGIAGSYKLYENEIVLNDNCIYIEMANGPAVYTTYNVLGLLASNNKTFCNSISKFHQAIMSKSNLISQVGEKERNRFFNKLHDTVNKFKKAHSIV